MFLNYKQDKGIVAFRLLKCLVFSWLAYLVKLQEP